VKHGIRTLAITSTRIAIVKHGIRTLAITSTRIAIVKHGIRMNDGQELIEEEMLQDNSTEVHALER
jgi:hypothetical protein